MLGLTPLLADVDDLSVAREGAPEREGHGYGALDIGGGDRLDVDVRLGAVAGVPAARELGAYLHALSRPDSQAALLEMAEGDHDTTGLDEHVVTGKRDSPCSGTALLGEGIADRR